MKSPKMPQPLLRAPNEMRDLDGDTLLECQRDEDIGGQEEEQFEVEGLG